MVFEMFMIVALRGVIWLVLAGYGLAQQSPFCPSPNGDFPNPASETCASYFRCVQGRALALRCPSDEAFDFLLRRCSPSDDVNCQRQLQLFATPLVGSSDWFLGGQFQGQGQPFPNPFSFLGGQAAAGGPGQLFPQGLWGQQIPQGQDALPLQVPVGQGAFGQQANAGQLPQGSFAQPLFPQGQGAQQFPQGQQGSGTGAGTQGISVGADGQLTAGGKPIGRMYPTPHGTVIVITKQPGQQQSLIPNIQKVNTVPFSPQTQPQQGTQQATPIDNQAANQPARPVEPQGHAQPAQNVQSNQPSQTDHAVQSDPTDANGQAIGQDQSHVQPPGYPLFINNPSQDYLSNGVNSVDNNVNSVF